MAPIKQDQIRGAWTWRCSTWSRHVPPSRRSPILFNFGYIDNEINADTETRGTTRAAPHLAHATALAQRIVQILVKRLRCQPKGIQEVALAGAVRPNQHRQWAKTHVTRDDAAVVPQLDAPDVKPFDHTVRLSSALRRRIRCPRPALSPRCIAPRSTGCSGVGISVSGRAAAPPAAGRPAPPHRLRSSDRTAWDGAA